MTLHRRAQQLRCHHCGAQAAVPTICANCQQALLPVGQGTERVEETLTRIFPDAPLARLDRDSASVRGSMQTVLERVHSGEARILVGTQMLTRVARFRRHAGGHSRCRPGLFASDFRATERLAQTITQVAGRPHEARPGEVVIQTQFPEPALNRPISEGYNFAASAGRTPRAGWPLLTPRCCRRNRIALRWTSFCAATAARNSMSRRQNSGAGCCVDARRADRYRAHLLSRQVRADFAALFVPWLPKVENLPGPQVAGRST